MIKRGCTVHSHGINDKITERLNRAVDRVSDALERASTARTMYMLRITRTTCQREDGKGQDPRSDCCNPGSPSVIQPHNKHPQKEPEEPGELGDSSSERNTMNTAVQTENVPLEHQMKERSIPRIFRTSSLLILYNLLIFLLYSCWFWNDVPRCRHHSHHRPV